MFQLKLYRMNTSKYTIQTKCYNYTYNNSIPVILFMPVWAVDNKQQIYQRIDSLPIEDFILLPIMSRTLDAFASCINRDKNIRIAKCTKG